MNTLSLVYETKFLSENQYINYGIKRGIQLGGSDTWVDRNLFGYEQFPGH